jgi:S-formylglutathione hydrolase
MKKLKSHKCFEGATEFWSHASRDTGTEMKFSTFIPQGEVKGCIIWLSGLTCNEENFITKAGAQGPLSRARLMVIAPDTSPRGLNLPREHDSYDFGSGAGFYVNATVAPYSSHYRMDDYVVNELYSLITDEFKARSVSIMGHSMGGHGALVLGLRNPEKFKSISAFSPIVHPSAAPWGIKAFTGYLGEDRSAWAAYDATSLVESGKKHPSKILIDQGTKDEFLAKELLTEDFARAARAAGQDCEIRLREGYDHSYYFISTFIESHVQHHGAYLGGEQ